MDNSGLKHQRIIANAGSGKTYRLTTRYIELLERQVPAERIVALTFTRKAAGEFLDAIFERSCRGHWHGGAFSVGVPGSPSPTHRKTSPSNAWYA